MLNQETKRRIDAARQVLVGKVPDPKAQTEQITTALIYKFMDDMDKQSIALGGKPSHFIGEYQKYAWDKLMDAKLGGHERLKLYSEAIESFENNPSMPQLFRDIFKDAFLPYNSPETLNLFLKEINGFSSQNSENLGTAYEYLLSVLGSQGDAGQFRTPRHIIDFIVAAIDPKKHETICDPACGSAGFLISAYKHILSQHDSQTDPAKTALTPDDRGKLVGNFVGYDIDPVMVRLSLVNMYLHGFPQPTIEEYDTLSSDEKWDNDFNIMLANPPFMTPKGGVMPHQRFSVQAKRSEILFVDYIAEHLKIKGRAGVIVPEGIIFQSANAYKTLRKNLVENWGLYAVVSLPNGVFQPYSGVKTSILFIDKELAKKTDEILFVKVNNDGFDLGAQRRPIDKNDLPAALKIITEHKLKLSQSNSAPPPSARRWRDLPYNPNLKQRARELRQARNLPEVLFWQKVKNKQLMGLDFDRQRVIGEYIVDFYCKNLGAVVEIDGGSHKGKQDYDAKRERFLQNLDLLVVRFKDFEVKDNIDKVLARLRDELASRLAEIQTPRQAMPDAPLKEGNATPRLATQATPLKEGNWGAASPSLKGWQAPPDGVATNLTPTQNDMRLAVKKDKIAANGEYNLTADRYREAKYYSHTKWPMIELGELEKQEKIQFLRGHGISKKDIVETGKNKCIHYGEIYTLYQPVIKTVISRTDFEGKVLSKKGDVLIPTTTTADAMGIAVARSLNEDGVLLGGDINIIRTENQHVLSDYLALLISAPPVKNELATYAKGVNILHISNKDIRNLTIPLPPLEVQQQIVDAIEVKQRAIEAARQLIKSLERERDAILVNRLES